MQSKNQTSILPTGLILVCVMVILGGTGCTNLNVNRIGSRLTPSNDRDWKPEVATIPFAEIEGSQFTIRNIRNCNYLSEEDYVVNYYDRQISLGEVQSVDFIVVPFPQTPKLAHTMISFGMSDGTYLAVSVEVRKERGEKFNPVLGLGRQFELIYVLSDERDVIRLRTKHRNSEVFVYPTVATAKQSQSLFRDVMKRVNKLSVEPEFYNSITNNCTTNLAGHVNEISAQKKITYGWKVLLPGLSAEYAYELGLLDNRIPFEDLKMIARVNELADRHYDDPDFSQHIRQSRYKVDRYAQRQAQREPLLNGRGDEFLQNDTRRGLRAERNTGTSTSRRDKPEPVQSQNSPRLRNGFGVRLSR
ncbi:MAG: DUF4105 domain-containing protein [Mariniblastus sp.]